MIAGKHNSDERIEMAKNDDKVKVKIGDKPVASRYRYGGYSSSTVYEMSREEGKEIVGAKLGNYVAAQKQAINKDESPVRGTVNSSSPTTAKGEK